LEEILMGLEWIPSAVYNLTDEYDLIVVDGNFPGVFYRVRPGENSDQYVSDFPFPGVDAFGVYHLDSRGAFTSVNSIYFGKLSRWWKVPDGAICGVVKKSGILFVELYDWVPWTDLTPSSAKAWGYWIP
jgi:hypothetical protein